MNALARWFHLAGPSGGLGLACEETGVSLAGASLLRKTVFGFEPRPRGELALLLRCAYGQEMDAASLEAGLTVVAQALNGGDLGRAMIAAVHLRLPDLNWDGAVRLAQVDDALAKYDPNEPRDARGRWTNSDGSAEDEAPRPMRSRLLVPLLPDDPEQSKPGQNSSPNEPDRTEPDRSWNGPITLEGGQLIHVQSGEPPGIGDNMPPPEAEPIPEAEPNLPGVRVPQGWDRPAYTLNGLHYPATREPLLRDGTPWPPLTPDVVRALLAPIGRGIPTLVAFVPRDGIGPILIGSTATSDYEQPSGYDSVTFFGTPQVTRSGGTETGHAEDGINEALDLARSNQFSKFYFNRSYSIVTNRMVQSLIRSDVVAVVRPELNLRYIYITLMKAYLLVKHVSSEKNNCRLYRVWRHSARNTIRNSDTCGRPISSISARRRHVRDLGRP